MICTNVRRLAWLCLLACTAPDAVLAADENVIDVTTKLDTLDAFDQRCSLREALKNANTNTRFSPVVGECVAGSGNRTDVIALPTTPDDFEYQLTLVDPGDDGGDLDVHDNAGVPVDVDDLRIETDADAFGAQIFQQVKQQRVLENHLARVTLKNIKLKNGSADHGGGILNSGGTMRLENVDVESSNAVANGGGIYNDGVMSFQGSDISKNKAGSLGGGVFNKGEMTIRGGAGSASYVSQNAAGSFGGGIHNAGGTLLLDGIYLQKNSAAAGGSIYNLADLTLANGSIVWVSKAVLAGGGIANAGNGNLLVTDSRVGDFNGGNRNEAGGPGGGIANLQDASLTLVNAAVIGSHAGGDGGGIYSDSTNPISIADSEISGNRALGDGGGLYLYPTAEATSDTKLLRTLVAENDSDGDGGGVWVGATASVHLANSTVSANNVYLAGAALFVNAGGVVDADNVTIFSPQGVYDPSLVNFGTITMRNSIVHAENESGACDAAGDPVSNVITSLGHNMFSDHTCAGLNAVGDSVGIDPMIAPLGDNGGPTQTHALQGFSPAIDAGDDAACAAPPVGGVDQRGALRPFGGGCDIGAHEQGGPIPDVLFADGFEG